MSAVPGTRLLRLQKTKRDLLKSLAKSYTSKVVESSPGQTLRPSYCNASVIESSINISVPVCSLD